MVARRERIGGRLGLRIVSVFFLCAVLGSIALAIAVRSAATAPAPHFVIEHSLEIDAPPAAVWAALVDFEALADWNPYLLQVEGALAEGGGIVITILQRNWEDTMTIPVTLVTVDPARRLGWRGEVLTPGVHDTHHYFVLTDLENGRTRFDHIEEFQGVLAWMIHTDATREHTRVAFADMNAALAQRAVELAGGTP